MLAFDGLEPSERTWQKAEQRHGRNVNAAAKLAGTREGRAWLLATLAPAAPNGKIEHVINELEPPVGALERGLVRAGNERQGGVTTSARERQQAFLWADDDLARTAYRYAYRTLPLRGGTLPVGETAWEAVRTAVWADSQGDTFRAVLTELLAFELGAVRAGRTGMARLGDMVSRAESVHRRLSALGPDALAVGVALLADGWQDGDDALVDTAEAVAATPVR
jgi:hypothetical protein